MKAGEKRKGMEGQVYLFNEEASFQLDVSKIRRGIIFVRMWESVTHNRVTLLEGSDVLGHLIETIHRYRKYLIDMENNLEHTPSDFAERYASLSEKQWEKQIFGNQEINKEFDSLAIMAIKIEWIKQQYMGAYISPKHPGIAGQHSNEDSFSDFKCPEFAIAYPDKYRSISAVAGKLDVNPYVDRLYIKGNGKPASFIPSLAKDGSGQIIVGQESVVSIKPVEK